MDRRQEAEELFDVVEGFYEALEGRSRAAKAGTIAMVVAAWYAAHRAEDRQKVRNDHAACVSRFLPTLVDKFWSEHDD